MSDAGKPRGSCCFFAGTHIMTVRGEVPVERLRRGDPVVILGRRGRWLRPIRAVQRVTDAPELRAAPVCLAAGSLGPGRPHRALRLPAEHGLLIDGVLVPARVLVGFGGVTWQAEAGPAIGIRLTFETHDILLAEGAPVEVWPAAAEAAGVAGRVARVHAQGGASKAGDPSAPGLLVPSVHPFFTTPPQSGGTEVAWQAGSSVLPDAGGDGRDAMDGVADAGGATRPETGRTPRAPVASAAAPEGVLSFDTDLRVGLVSGRATVLLGLSRQARRAQGLAELLEGSPRLDRDATAALLAACLAATTPGGDPEADLLRLSGAPGLRFAIRKASRGTFVLGIAPDPVLVEGGGIDPLTGLADRAMFQARLAAALDRPARRRFGAAVLLCDLEGIRAVNQVLGHAIGEDLLRAAARRLQAAVRDGDLVARLAGEEFAVLQSEVGDPAHASALAGRLVDLLGRAYQISGETIVVTPRIGVAIAPADGADAPLLLRRAAMARHEAPTAGGGSWRRFSPEMDVRWQESRALEAALRIAVAEEQFELHYQPQVALPDRRLTGFEALIRWRHPDRGLLTPSAFLPMAEGLGLMRRIGEWVLREACRAAATWPETLRVAVNISPAQFEDDALPGMVEAALAESGLAPGRLELEVTETVLLASGDAALAQLQALRERGVGIAMDDFGTGHSSLTQLRAFPFDRLKIDRSFVKDLPAGGDALAIVRAVTGLGRSLGIAVTAEGVETQAQVQELLREGCDAAQGFLFGRPVPGSDVPAVIGALAAA
jgi:diguanylate cyclase (GGDEF)-like protein